jgi:hypothetical protein
MWTLTALVGTALSSVAMGQVFAPLPKGTVVDGLYPASYDMGKILGKRTSSGYNASVPAGYWIWDRASATFAPLPALPAGYSIWGIYEISGDGTTVAGGIQNSLNQVHGAIYTTAGGWVDAGAASGDTSSIFYSINGDGTMAGGLGGPPEHAVKWTSAGGTTVFPLSYGGSTARITGFSEDGSVMVGTAGDVVGAMQPWRWTAATGVQDLPKVSNWTRPLISANGDWVLGRNGAMPFVMTTYRWSVAGGQEDLPLPENGTIIEGYGISDDGRVVVGISGNGLSTSFAWLWREGWGSINFDTYLRSRLSPATLAGWQLGYLVALSRDGTKALGRGQLNGVETAYIVDIPPVCLADIGRSGGVQGPDGLLNNNDFIVFIDLFFASSPRADIGMPAGTPGSDGVWDNNDFIVYIDRFFAGC